MVTGNVTSKLITLPQGGYDNFPKMRIINPDRMMPRHVSNLGVGTDNLFHTKSVSA
jgi:hypothetical protein